MALYKVDSDTADLTKVAGGTLYADLPIGSWIKNDMATIPSGFLKVGDTISQSEYPELYAKYGSTVPYKADKSELDSYSTNVSYSMLSNSSGYTMLYDGFIEIRMQGSSGQAGPTATLTVNNSTTMQCGNYQDGSRRTQLFFFRKGDVLKVANANSSSFECKIAYYKKSLIVKAKHTPVPVDLMDAVFNEVNKIRNTQIVIGTSRTVTVQGTMAERWSANLPLPTIPDGKKVLRWFAVVLSQATNTNGCATVGYTGSSGIPTSIITVPDNDGTMEIAYAAEIF